MTADLQSKESSLLDAIARGVATGGGAGFSPVAPGTLGSLEGVALFIIFIVSRPVLENAPAGPILQLSIINVIVFALGVWASASVCRLSGLGDPQIVVVDEISGQLIALTPLADAPSIVGVLAGFVLFRVFDILKPPPIRQLERLHGGFGVMADDALAGLAAAALVWAGHHYSLF